MSNNPIDLIGGLTDTSNVSKADIVAWAKARVPQVLGNNAEIRTTNLAGQMVVFVKAPGISWYQDTLDATTADDDLTCVISLDGKRFKPLSSIPSSTLGGVYSLAPITHQYVVGIDTDGTVLIAQPSASDLSDGLTGTGTVVRNTSPTLVTPALGAASATSVNKVAITTPATGATLTIADGKTLTVSKSLTLDGTDGTILTGPSTSQTLLGRTDVATVTNKSLDASANTITNLTTGMFAANTVDTDATLAANSDTRLSSQKAVKSYVDNLLTGLSWKLAVAVATTANVTLSGEQTIDGVLTSASRILVKNQSTASQNGIYVTAAGAWTRSADMDSAVEFPSAAVFVQGGTVNGDTQWTCTNNSVTVGSTSVTFAQVSGAGTYSAGTGLQLSGNQFAVDSTIATLTGAQALTNKTYNGNTWTAGTGILTIGAGKTLTASNTLSLTGTDGSSVAFGGGGTVAYVANKLSVFAATTSAELAGVISDETGSGLLVFATSPALAGTPTTPTAAVDTNTTQVASTAFVIGQASAVGDGTPAMDGTAARGSSTHFARADHVHPTDTSRAPANAALAAIEYIIDGGGSVITTGMKGYLQIPFACTISQSTLLADQSGSIVVDVWKCTQAQFDAGATRPVSTDKITASAPPTISSSTKAQDSTLTGWTTSIAAGDILAFNVNSVTTIQRATLALKVTKT